MPNLNQKEFELLFRTYKLDGCLIDEVNYQAGDKSKYDVTTYTFVFTKVNFLEEE